MFPYLILLLLAILVFLLLAGGLYFALQVVHPKCYTVEETYRIEIETGKMIEAEWLSWERQEVILPSPFGYDLFGVYLPLAGADRTVIIAHGITYTLFGSVKYVNLFRGAALTSCCTIIAIMAAAAGAGPRLAIMKNMTWRSGWPGSGITSQMEAGWG